MRNLLFGLAAPLLGACGGASSVNDGAPAQSLSVAGSWLPIDEPITMVSANSHNDYANGRYDLEEAPLTFVRLSNGDLRVVWRGEAYTAELDPETDGYFFGNDDGTLSLRTASFGDAPTQSVIPVLFAFEDTRDGSFFADNAVSLFGDPTPDAVVHARGAAATFTGTAHLQVIRGVNALPVAQGAATISANFERDIAQGQLVFAANPASGISQDVTATLIGGSLDGAGLSGTMVMPAEAVGVDTLSPLLVRGGFFGPAGQEIAGQFSGQGTEANFGAFEIKVLGAFSAR